MTKPMNTGAYERATQRSWEDWVSFLDGLGARDRDHADIVPLVQGEILVQDEVQRLDLKNHGWWAQGITIAYEQHIGQRIPGQKSDGSFPVSASKTFPGPMDDALATWTAPVSGRSTFNGLDVDDAPSTSSTPKWRYWRCSLSDGSRVNVTIIEVASNESGSGKSRVAVEHSQLVSPEEATELKSFWKALLADL